MTQTLPAAARYWIAVASAEHVRKGRTEGFMQVCHGKAAPLRRIAPGDGIVYYSPSEQRGAGGKCQRFTALGAVRQDAPYQVDMGGGFTPFRRDVDWAKVRETPIAPLLEQLEFSAGKRNWGYALRFGVVEISASDFETIRMQMTADFPD